MTAVALLAASRYTLSVRRLALILMLCCIPGAFIVRTWRLEHSGVPREALEQYLLDKREIDDSFLRRAPVVVPFQVDEEPLAHALERFTQVTGIPVEVRWEALAKDGVGPNMICRRTQFWNMKPEELLVNIIQVPDSLEVRCRHRALVVSKAESFAMERVFRRYPVNDLLDLNPGWLFGWIVYEARPSGLPEGNDPLFEGRFRDGMLNVWGPLEAQVHLYEDLQSLRRAMKSASGSR